MNKPYAYRKITGSTVRSVRQVSLFGGGMLVLELIIYEDGNIDTSVGKKTNYNNNTNFKVSFNSRRTFGILSWSALSRLAPAPHRMSESSHKQGEELSYFYSFTSRFSFSQILLNSWQAIGGSTFGLPRYTLGLLSVGSRYIFVSF